MFKRLFWLVVGAGFGFGVAFFLLRFVRQAVERVAPERVRGDVAQALRDLGRDVREAVAEGREAMREREAAIRAELGEEDGSTDPAGATGNRPGGVTPPR